MLREHMDLAKLFLVNLGVHMWQRSSFLPRRKENGRKTEKKKKKELESPSTSVNLSHGVFQFQENQ